MKKPRIGDTVLVTLLFYICQEPGEDRDDKIPGQVIDSHQYKEFRSLVVHLVNGQTLEIPENQLERK